MKPIISIILSVIILHGSIVAQESSQQRRSIFFQGAIEAGLVRGDLYEAVSDSPFQLGCRIGLYGFISHTVAIGGSLRASIIPFGYSPGGSPSGGGGPDIIITGKIKPEQYSFFAGFHAHYIRQKVSGTFIQCGYHFCHQISQSESVGGIEIGARIGGMKLTGGVTYGTGLAIDLMHDAPDGIRFYITLGGASSSAKSDS